MTAPAKLPASIPQTSTYKPEHWLTCPTLARQRIFDAIYNEAREAAIEATKPFQDKGACGFAWVVFRPATHPFIRHMKATGRGSRHWSGGWHFWSPGEFAGQAVDAHEAGADAFAAKLREYWPDDHIYAASRLD